MKTNINEAAMNMVNQSQKRLAEAIISQKAKLNESFEMICKDLMGIDTNQFSLHQKFQGISTLDRTLDVMLAFYESSYKVPFDENDWIEEKKEEISLPDVLNRLADSLQTKC